MVVVSLPLLNWPYCWSQPSDYVWMPVWLFLGTREGCEQRKTAAAARNSWRSASLSELHSCIRETDGSTAPASTIDTDWRKEEEGTLLLLDHGMAIVQMPRIPSSSPPFPATGNLPLASGDDHHRISLWTVLWQRLGGDSLSVRSPEYISLKIDCACARLWYAALSGERAHTGCRLQ